MSLLWVEVDDAPSPQSIRGYVERNAIGLLSSYVSGAEAILSGGFRDANHQVIGGSLMEGVWVSDVPVDASEGAKGGVLLTLTVDESRLAEFELIEEGPPRRYREFCVPAKLLNRGHVEIQLEDEWKPGELEREVTRIDELLGQLSEHEHRARRLREYRQQLALMIRYRHRVRGPKSAGL